MYDLYRKFDDESLKTTIKECREFIDESSSLFGIYTAARETIKICLDILKDREDGKDTYTYYSVDYLIGRFEERNEKLEQELELDERLRNEGKEPLFKSEYIRENWKQELKQNKEDLKWFIKAEKKYPEKEESVLVELNK